MSENKTNGQIQIADEVVGVIATTAALEVEGVVAGGGKGFVELFGKKGHTKCAKITKDADEAVLDMDIIVNFGTKSSKLGAMTSNANNSVVGNVLK